MELRDFHPANIEAKVDDVLSNSWQYIVHSNDPLVARIGYATGLFNIWFWGPFTWDATLIYIGTKTVRSVNISKDPETSIRY